MRKPSMVDVWQGSEYTTTLNMFLGQNIPSSKYTKVTKSSEHAYEYNMSA